MSLRFEPLPLGVYDISLLSRFRVDLVDGLFVRRREDLARVDQAADDAAFTVAVSTIATPTP